MSSSRSISPFSVVSIAESVSCAARSLSAARVRPFDPVRVQVREDLRAVVDAEVVVEDADRVVHPLEQPDLGVLRDAVGEREHRGLPVSPERIEDQPLLVGRDHRPFAVAAADRVVAETRPAEDVPALASELLDHTRVEHVSEEGRAEAVVAVEQLRDPPAVLVEREIALDRSRELAARRRGREREREAAEQLDRVAVELVPVHPELLRELVVEQGIGPGAAHHHGPAPVHRLDHPRDIRHVLGAEALDERRGEVRVAAVRAQDVGELDQLRRVPERVAVVLSEEPARERSLLGSGVVDQRPVSGVHEQLRQLCRCQARAAGELVGDLGPEGADLELLGVLRQEARIHVHPAGERTELSRDGRSERRRELRHRVPPDPRAEDFEVACCIADAGRGATHLRRVDDDAGHARTPWASSHSRMSWASRRSRSACCCSTSAAAVSSLPASASSPCETSPRDRP